MRTTIFIFCIATALLSSCVKFESKNQSIAFDESDTTAAIPANPEIEKQTDVIQAPDSVAEPLEIMVQPLPDKTPEQIIEEGKKKDAQKKYRID